jgi:hypothetical protein
VVETHRKEKPMKVRIVKKPTSCEQNKIAIIVVT